MSLLTHRRSLVLLIAATALWGGGAGLRVVTGESHTVRGISNIALGASNTAVTLDAIDSTSSGTTNTR